ncbi:sulfatase-like hydrolase/transferase [Rhodococcus hoagii]|nr:sulfatase-like hydrolase/transferase [Prescottella equi]
MNTPTLDRMLGEGIAYNRFHTTAMMCSPTPRVATHRPPSSRVGTTSDRRARQRLGRLLRSHPKSSATGAEVLRHYGYTTAAFGKWHNTPPRRRPPPGLSTIGHTGVGFDYFYGFLAGEASQYEPNLVRKTTVVLPPKTPEEGYHLSEDLADDAIGWLRRHKALDAERPFFMYWASGCLHGPHHIMKPWGRPLRRQVRRRVGCLPGASLRARQGQGLDSAEAELTDRDPTMTAWDDIPEDEKPFQRRLMEVAAGYAEHCDVQIGRLFDELDHLGYRDNTLVLYIWGDNGSSGEGQNGTISELLAQNGIPTTTAQHIAALDELGGLDVLGSPKTDNMYPRRVGVGGEHAVQGNEAAGLASRRHPQPDGCAVAREDPADPAPRTQFLHCNDIVPTFYELLGITAPRTVNGIAQDPIDGASFASTLVDRDAKAGKLTQYFEIMGSRAIYHDGWMASAFGPRAPWVPGLPGGVRGLEPRRRHLGALPPRRGLDPEPGPRPGTPGEARPAAGDLRDRGGAEQCPPRGRRSLGRSHPPRTENLDALHELGVHGRHRPDARVLRTCVGQQGKQGHRRTDRSRAGRGRPLLSGRQQRRSDVLHGRRLPVLRVQPVHPGAYQGSLAPSVPRTAHDRSATEYADPRPGGPLNIRLSVDGLDPREDNGSGERTATVHRELTVSTSARPSVHGVTRLP